MSKNIKVYISGAMSDQDPEVMKQNIERFHDAARLLRAAGCQPVNPARAWPCRWGWIYRTMERWLGKDAAYRTVLCYDLWLLSRCDVLCLIDGWRDSRGAKIEEHFAYHMGIVRSYRYDPKEKKLTQRNGTPANLPTPTHVLSGKKRQRQREHRAAEKVAKESAAVQ